MRKLALAALVVAPAAGAHHEAIFGPQSSLVMSSPAFLSAQLFTKRLEGGRQEATFLLSGSATPFHPVPLSLTAIAPMSYIAGGGAPSRSGLEDLILGARYRFDLEPLQRATGKDGNFLLAMGAAELPTGSIDHPAFDGPVNEMAAGLWSGETGALSGIGYAFYRRSGWRSDVRPDTLFLGGGIAWTPWDDPISERLLSVQLGYSHERAFAEGVSTADLLHPTLVWGPGGHLLSFLVVSIPLRRSGSIGEQDLWRIGAGLVLLLGR